MAATSRDLRRLILLALVLLVAACGSDVAAPPEPLVGTYALQTVDGQAVPYRFLTGTGFEDYISGGSLTFVPGSLTLAGSVTFMQQQRRHSIVPNPDGWTELAGYTWVITYIGDGNELTVLTVSEAVPPPHLSVSADATVATLDFVIDPYVRSDAMVRYIFRKE